MRLARLLLLPCVLAAAPAFAQEPVAVNAAPVRAFEEQHPEQTRFGALRFIGGLQLDSPDNHFGGLSGIEISTDGRRLLMVSDLGDLFAATIDYSDGVPIGLSDVTLARLAGENGEPLDGKFGSDAESLRAANGNGLPDDILVGFERDNRVLRYKVDGDASVRNTRRIVLPDAVADLQYNKGLEGIAVFPPGAPNAGDMVVFAESSPDAAAGVIPGWLVSGEGYRDLGLKRTSGFDLTDVVALPNGDLIVLERSFSMFLGVAMRLRRISANELEGPQPMSGTTLLTAGMAHAVDNMEGLAIHRDEAGRTILTIVSDDNFSALQRTLILQFELL